MVLERPSALRAGFSSGQSILQIVCHSIQVRLSMADKRTQNASLAKVLECFRIDVIGHGVSKIIYRCLGASAADRASCRPDMPAASCEDHVRPGCNRGGCARADLRPARRNGQLGIKKRLE